MRPLRKRSAGASYVEFTTDSEGDVRQIEVNETTPQKRVRPSSRNIQDEEDIKIEPESPTSTSRTRIKMRHSYVEFPTDTEGDDEMTITVKKRGRSRRKPSPSEENDANNGSVTKRGRTVANTSYAELSSDLDDVEDVMGPSTSRIIERPASRAVEKPKIETPEEILPKRTRKLIAPDLRDLLTSDSESNQSEPEYTPSKTRGRPAERSSVKKEDNSDEDQVRKATHTPRSKRTRKSDSEEVESKTKSKKRVMKRKVNLFKSDKLKKEESNEESETEAGWKARLRAYSSAEESSSEEEAIPRRFRNRRSEPPVSKDRPRSAAARSRPSIVYTEEQTESEQEPVAKKRGRPPGKISSNQKPENTSSRQIRVQESSVEESDSEGESIKNTQFSGKKRGRPPKQVRRFPGRTSHSVPAPIQKKTELAKAFGRKSTHVSPSKYADLERPLAAGRSPTSVRLAIERKKKHKSNDDDIMLSKLRRAPLRTSEGAREELKAKLNYEEIDSDEENQPGTSRMLIKRNAKSAAETAMNEISAVKEEKKTKQIEKVKKESRKRKVEVSDPEDDTDSEASDEELERFDPKDLEVAEKLIKSIYLKLRDEHRDEGTDNFFNMVGAGGFQKTYKTANDEACKPLLLQALPLEGAIETVKVTTIPAPTHTYRIENKNGTVKNRTFPRHPECNVEVPAIFTPSAEALPRCKYFQYIDHNIKTDDTLRLSHVPYVSDTHDSRTFYQELKPLYNEGVHGARKGWKQHISDFQMYLLLKELIPDWQTKGKSINCLYRVIYKLFPNKYTTRELENAFTSLQLRFLPKNETPISIITQKAKEDIHHSIDSMFCILCQQYNCLTHGELCEEETRRMHRKPRAEHQYSTPCGNDCVSKLVEFKKILEGSPVKPLKSPSKGKDVPSYKGYQQLHFEKLVNLNRHSYCQLTTMMNILAPKEKKTCQEIYQLSKRVPPPKRERSPDNIMESKYSSKEQITSFRKFTWSEGGGNVDNSIQMIPCRHKGPCGPKATGCLCFERGTLCTKYCACGPDCRRRFPGCRCQPGACRTKQCQCFYAKWECDPDVCKSCNCGPFNPDHVNENDETGDCVDKPIKRDRVPRCSNIRLQSGDVKKLRMGASVIAGMGCFIDESAEKGDLIAEYMGEVISSNEAERRGRIYDEFRCSFIFKLNEQQSVDATSMGNVIRFANHSDKNPNCYSEIIVANGEHRIGIFAKRNIEAGEELTFDYKYEKHAKEAYVPVELTRRRLSEDNE